MKKGFSLVEVLLAVAAFAVFSVAAIVALVSSLDINRSANEYIVATQFASEGIEAVRSIKNQSYDTFSTPSATIGITVNPSGNWVWGGTNNVFDSGRYTRTIRVDAVSRDGSGNIVASGGTNDTATKKVTSTVTWNYSSGRINNASVSAYLTNWESAIFSSGNGFVVYGDTTGVAQPKIRYYTNTTNVFDAAVAAGSGYTDSVVGKTFKSAVAPTRKEAVVGYVNSSGVLNVLCFDGSTWTSEWTTTVGGTGTNDARFGIAYETNSGDAMVVYSRNVGTTAEMGYRTKSGSLSCGAANWSSETTITTVRTTGIVQWIRTEASPVSSSNTIALAWADANSDLSAMEWTGASWAVSEPTAALETDLNRVAASQDSLSFDIAFENTTGNLMVAWSHNRTSCTAGATFATTNCIRYARYTSSWSAVVAIPTVSDQATNIDISANPKAGSNEIIMSAIDKSSSDLSTAYWSGSAWTGRSNVDTSSGTPLAGTKLTANAWLTSGATTRYVIVYMDSTGNGVSWYVGNGSGAPAKQTDFAAAPAIGNPKKWIDISMDPLNSDRLMTVISDLNSDLFAKRLVMTSVPAFTWTNSDGGVSALTQNLGSSTAKPFSFSYWKI